MVALNYWVPLFLGLGVMDKFLCVMQNETAEQDKASIEPDVEQCLAGPDDAYHREANHSSQAHLEGLYCKDSECATPLKELFTWGVISDKSKTSNGKSSGKNSIINDWHANRVNQWDQ